MYLFSVSSRHCRFYILFEVVFVGARASGGGGGGPKQVPGARGGEGGRRAPPQLRPRRPPPGVHKQVKFPEVHW